MAGRIDGARCSPFASVKISRIGELQGRLNTLNWRAHECGTKLVQVAMKPMLHIETRKQDDCILAIGKHFGHRVLLELIAFVEP